LVYKGIQRITRLGRTNRSWRSQRLALTPTIISPPRPLPRRHKPVEDAPPARAVPIVYEPGRQPTASSEQRAQLGTSLWPRPLAEMGRGTVARWTRAIRCG
jgi:hypothetical protein